MEIPDDLLQKLNAENDGVVIERDGTIRRIGAYENRPKTWWRQILTEPGFWICVFIILMTICMYM